MKDALVQIGQSIEGLTITESLKVLAQTFPSQITFSSSLGQEDQVITHFIFDNDIPISVFTLDTGRLFQETYDVLAYTKARYKKEIQVYFPEAAAIEKLITEKGPNSFYQSIENRKECCGIRKIEPLQRALNGQKIWVTGLRASQSNNRQSMSLLEYDEKFGVIKYNPLIHWSIDEVESFIKEHKIPQNTLHAKGFVSIGCQPCTRAIEPGEDIRAGRWWWEQTQKECGLHA